MIFCTVIVLLYNPDREKLCRTLKSIAFQKHVVVQVVIADDGSDQDYIKESEKILTNHVEFQYCKQEKNKGTVWNIWNALHMVKYEYASLISPGDYFFDEFTLYDVYKKMIDKNLKFLFGRIVPYQWRNSKLITYEKQFPIYIDPYKKKDNPHIKKKILKYLVVYNDTMIGPTLFWRKSILLKYIALIVGRVTYIEDLISKFAILDDEKYDFLDRYTVWYEYGDGISTAKSKKKKKKISDDTSEFYSCLCERYPESKMVYRARLFGDIVKLGGIKSFFLRSILFPDRVAYYFLYTYVIKNNLIPINTAFIENLYVEKVR